MATPQPIAGNQNFTSVVDMAAQLPTLNVTDLTASDELVQNLLVVNGTVENLQVVNETVQELEIKDGHLLTAQTTPPTVAVTGALTGGTVFVNSTDVAGQVNLTGTAGAGDTFVITYNSPYPSAVQTVTLTACDAAAATALTNGVHVSTSATAATVTFVGASGANPCFNYFVIDPVAA